MGIVVSLDYSSMRETYKKANMVSEKCTSYANKIESKINQKISSLQMGGNSNTSQANYFAKQKIARLNEKKAQCSKYASKVEIASDFAKDTDANVSKYIKNASKDFRKTHNMKVGVIAEFFAWATTTLLNATAFGRWLNQVCKDVSTWIDNVKRSFKDWRELDGGKYVIKTVLAVVGIIAASIFLVIAAWPALLAIIGEISAAGLAGLTGAMIWTLVTSAAAFVSAVSVVFDGVTKAISNFAAALSFEDDPGWAQRYSSYSSLSEFLQKNNFNTPFSNKIAEITANIIDGITIAASVINIVDLVHNGVNVVKRLKEGGMAKIFNKVHFKSPSGKVTIGTIKHGVKNVIRNAGELKKLVTATNVSRMHTYYEKTNKLYDTYKALKTNKKIWNVVENINDKGISAVIGDEIKSLIRKNSTSHEYGSKTADLIKRINNYKKVQKPAYALENRF